MRASVRNKRGKDVLIDKKKRREKEASTKKRINDFEEKTKTSGFYQ